MRSVTTAAQMLLDRMCYLEEVGWFQAFLDILLSSVSTLEPRECEEVQAEESQRGRIAASEKLVTSLLRSDKPNWFKLLKHALENCDLDKALDMLETNGGGKAVKASEWDGELEAMMTTVCFKFREETEDMLISSNNTKSFIIVGLTASVSISSFKSRLDAENNILQLCANLDTRVITTVTEHKDELKSYVHMPEKAFFEVKQCTSHPFIRIIKNIMSNIEQLAQKTYNIESLLNIQSREYGSQKYEQWLISVQKSWRVLQMKNTDEERHICRERYNYTEHLWPAFACIQSRRWVFEEEQRRSSKHEPSAAVFVLFLVL
ncbi:probable ATP-dependent RNA helicase DDX58 [Sinocyclocheilus anshuiensis]|uniref:probable ATP-dependent RNA helicase DDX58 n=1 Tax=Sinocyclocheilus anshuiensis TaxID=1608454 RepID=UPI0007B87661|nr:PREDICTED: probable ATP-dependent RNA helicase DDX58 [Sinocyclocheilus anshuiensis]